MAKALNEAAAHRPKLLPFSASLRMSRPAIAALCLQEPLHNATCQPAIAAVMLKQTQVLKLSEKQAAKGPSQSLISINPWHAEATGHRRRY